MQGIPFFSLLSATFFVVSPFDSSLASSPSPGTRQIPITVKEGGGTFQGSLFLPENRSGALPLVVVAPEWWGKTDYPDKRAQRIATELGAAAVSVDLYGQGKTVETPQEAQAEATPFYKNPEMGVRRLKAFLAEAPRAAKDAGITLDTSKIIAIGYCFGGTQVLNLARSGEMPGGETLAGVVSFHGGLSSSLRAKGPITAKVLVLHGEADQMVKPEEVAAFKKEMANDKADLKFFAYPGAQHAFSNPKATAIGERYKIPVAYDENADKKSWAEFKEFYKSLTSS